MFSFREQKQLLLNVKMGVLAVNKEIAFRHKKQVDKELKCVVNKKLLSVAQFWSEQYFNSCF